MSTDCRATEIAEEFAAARGGAASGDGAILFACTAHAGQINPLLSIAGELSRRDVPALWFAATDNRRGDIEEAAMRSPIQFVSCGINDRTKELVEDSAVYSAFAQNGPMTTSSFLLALRWMFNQERLAIEYERMLVHIDRIQPSLMVIDTSTIGAIDAAMTRRVPFILSGAVYAQRIVHESVAVGLSPSWFRFAPTDERRPESCEPLVSTSPPGYHVHAVSVFFIGEAANRDRNR
jgi:hypothetical protein